MKKNLAPEVISFLFVLLFVYAATSKLFEYETFVIQVGQSPLLTGLGNTIPWMVIAAELIIAAMLAFHKLRLAGFFAAFSLMTMFTTYIIIILNYSSFVPCSCGGVLEKLGWTEHLIFNIVFTLLGAIAIVLQHRIQKA
jgi:hypothetical protein